jgi:hypothetical protein
VNIGAVAWPDPNSAYVAVRMTARFEQGKLWWKRGDSNP